MAKKDNKPKPKQRVHVGKLLIAAGAATSLGMIPNSASGDEAPLTKLGYAADAAEEDNWWDPSSGVAANVSMATEGLAGNLLSVDGVVVVGGGVALWELLKHSGVGRRSTFKTAHHSIGLAAAPIALAGAAVSPTVGAVAAAAALAIAALVAIGTRRRASMGALQGNTGQMRYATSSVATTSANTAASESITLPVAAIPRTIRVAANGVALMELLVDNVTKVSVQAQPSGNPQEAPIPAGAFPQPVTSVTVLLTNPATTGGQALLAIGY